MSLRSPNIAVPYTDYALPEEPVEEPQPTTSRGNAAKRKKLPPAVRRREIPPEPVYAPRPCTISEQQWYSSEPLEDLEASLGLLTLSGITTEALEQRVQLFRVRNQYNPAVRMTE